MKCGGASKNRATVMLLGDSTGHRYPPFVVVKTASSKDPTTQAEDTKMRCGLEKKVWSEIMPLSDQFDMSIHTNSKGEQYFFVLPSYFPYIFLYIFHVRLCNRLVERRTVGRVPEVSLRW